MTLQKLVTFLPKMSATFTSWFQTAAFLLQAVDVTQLHESLRTRVVSAVGFIQAVQAVMAHHYAPTGEKLTAPTQQAPEEKRPTSPPPASAPGSGS